MKMFYMERGAGSSNLHMRFNLATTEPGTVSLDKAISGTDKQDYASVRFPYQVWYRDGGDGGDFRLLEQGANDAFGHNVTYKGTSEPVEYAARDGAYRSVFYLKPGQHADIHLPSEDTEYYIVECGVKSSLYDQVRANDVVLAGTPAGDGTKDYATARAVVSDRKRVTYDNHVDPSALRTLTITKRLFDEQDRELTAEDDPTGFRLRMYLGEDLDYYRLDSYYIKDPAGAYCTFEDGTFVSLGKTRFDDLTTAELEKATFTTSPSGAIDRITAGYSVEIRNLLVDTPFKVEERASDIPAGYALKEYRRVEGSYITEEGPNEGVIRDNNDPSIEVHNRRGWGLTVDKVWSDARFMSDHDPIYLAVYVGGELLEGSVRQLAAPASSTYYFFEHLEPGHGFDDYAVREVELTDASVDADGTVSYTALAPVEEGHLLHVGGTPLNGSHEEGLAYTATYETGSATGATAELHNVRADVVTNTRPGIHLQKTDWAGAALAGATFTLTNEDGEAVGSASYTSLASGRIATAYLSQGTFTLTETATPLGYRGLPEPLVIEVDDQNQVSVSGGAEGWYTVDDTNPDDLTITIKDKAMSFATRKYDAVTGEPLENVAFTLYRQYNGVKDPRPVAGFAGIRTTAAGLLEGVTHELGPGTYYLTEETTLQGYMRLTEDVVFTISATGEVTLESGGDADWLTCTEGEDGSCAYELAIPNGFGKTEVSFLKVDTANVDAVLSGAVFDLYRVRGAERTLLKKDMTSNEEGLLEHEGKTVFKLDVGDYELVETAAPDGYQMLAQPVRVTVSAQGVSYDDGYALSQNGQGITGNLAEGFTLKISNTAGFELPQSGGAGTAGVYVTGAILVAAGILSLALRKRRA